MTKWERFRQKRLDAQREKNTAYYREYYFKNKEKLDALNAEYRRNRYATLKANHICVDCGKANATTGVFCKSCADKEKKRRERRKPKPIVKECLLCHRKFKTRNKKQWRCGEC